MFTPRRMLWLCAALLLLPLLAACGSSDRNGWTSVGGESNGIALMSSGDALRAARRAMTDLSDATYRGTASLSSDSGTAQWKFRLVSGAGGACEYRLRRGASAMTLRRVDGTLYQTATPRMMRKQWNYPAELVELLRDAWVALPEDSGLRLPVCGLASLAPGPHGRGDFTATGYRQVRGEWARRFTGQGSSGFAPWLTTATQGEPRVLSLSGRLWARDSYRLRLVEADSGVELAAPPPSKLIDPGPAADGGGTLPVRADGSDDGGARASWSAALLATTTLTAPAAPH